MPKCFITRARSVVCHIEVTGAAGRQTAEPWIQDRLILRPLLTKTRDRATFVAATEGDALMAVLTFLEERLAAPVDPPVPCPEPNRHIKAGALPLAWTDQLTFASIAS